MMDALFWTSVVWAAYVGWAGSRMAWYLMSRREYE